MTTSPDPPWIMLMAAGSATRFGSNKLITPLDGRPILAGSVAVAIATGLRAVVVLGAYAIELRAVIEGLDVVVDFNPDWSKGLGNSIAHGIRSLATGPSPPSSVIIAMADQVALTPASYAALAACHLETGGDGIVVSHSAGVDGPPCLFPAAAFPALMALDGDAGARRVLKAWPHRVTRCNLPEAAADIDTTEDLGRYLRRRFAGNL